MAAQTAAEPLGNLLLSGQSQDLALLLLTGGVPQRRLALGVRHGADDGLEVLATDGHVVVQPEVVFGVELVDDLRVVTDTQGDSEWRRETVVGAESFGG